MGHLSTLLSKIGPAINEERITKENRTSGNETFVENVAEINVKRNVQEILNRSGILREMVKEGKIGIAGAMYEVGSGKVEMYDDTIMVNRTTVEAMTA
jgi:carbonic anhydrase